MLRRPLSWLVVALARMVRWGFYRRVEVVGLEHVPERGPVLIVANHYNGLVDAALVIAVLGRLPRFVAKSTLGDVPVIGWLLRTLGVVFVHRPEDVDAGSGGAGVAAGGVPSGNEAMFADTSSALINGSTVAIFPEGKTHDQPSLARIRTGAARMAITAQAGIDAVETVPASLRIVPVGVTYHDKIAVRSSALVAIGAPLAIDELDAAVGAGGQPVLLHDGEPDRALVAELTTAIGDRLRAVSPDYDGDGIEWASASLAASVYLRTRGEQSPPFDARDRVVRRIQALDGPRRDAVLSEVARYQLALDATGLDDDLVLEGAAITRPIRPLVLAALAATVLAPLATFGLVVNAAPTVLTVAAGLATTKPFMKGTFRALVAIVTFPAAWITAAVVLTDPLHLQVGVVGLALLGGIVVLVGIQSAIQGAEALIDLRRAWERSVPLGALRARREAMVDAVTATLRD